MNHYTRLAKLAVDAYIKEKKVIAPPEDLPESFLKTKSGVFVTIEKKDNLRGCIGTYLPARENIAEEIINNAIDSAVGDNRFDPVLEEELPDLSYAVYIIGKLETVKDRSELDPGKYGVLVKSNLFPNKIGILLPDLEGIDTVEKQINIACRKAGIDTVREKITILKFAVEKYE